MFPRMLSREESQERFEESDEDGDKYVTWMEHTAENYGDIGATMDKETTRVRTVELSYFYI